MTLKAVYPGTFDPITLGHHDLVRRAAGMFDEVILAVADSRSKRPFFTLDERVEMAKHTVAEYKNVSVTGFSGLLMDFAQKHDARIVMRGVRAASAPSMVPSAVMTPARNSSAIASMMPEPQMPVTPTRATPSAKPTSSDQASTSITLIRGSRVSGSMRTLSMAPGAAR